jgi:cytosine/adenosine deaminase-related metal-dependent hydrolase
MLRPPQSRGGVLVDGARVLAVGDAARLRPDADREVRHDGVLLPGLVDARTRVECADAQAAGARTATWDDERWARSARRGVHALLRAGVAASGDIVRRGAGVPASVRASLAGDSWLEITAVDRTEQDAVVAAAGRSLGLPARGRRVGLCPDPFALGTGVLQALSALATARQAPVHLAVGGDAAERRAFSHADGALADRARASGLDFEWLDEPPGRAPIAYLDALGLLTPRTTVAYARDVTLDEARVLARRRVTIVCCEVAPPGGSQEPPLHRFAEAGSRLALGSGGGGDVLAVAAAWVSLARRCGLARWPGRSGPLGLEEAAVRLATVDGAEAMGWGRNAGVLAAGRRADFTVLDLDTTPERVYVDVARDGAGRHVLTVLAGVRRARRATAADPWPAVEVEDLPGDRDRDEEGSP